MSKLSGRPIEILLVEDDDGDIELTREAMVDSNDMEEDILRSYELGVNCYVQKPVGMAEFMRIVQVLEDFWFTIVKLPPHS